MKYSQKTLNVGIVGTGYVAKRRAEAFLADGRAKLLYVTGNTPENIEAFCHSFSISAIDSWQRLVDNPEIDLVVICNINRDRGIIARAAIEAGKHLIVEYPLALNFQEAEEIVDLAAKKNLFLHVEHIELIGGLHQAIKKNLAAIGNVFSVRYVTISPDRLALKRWTYHRELFGFPLVAALSRVHRLTDLFGEVDRVNCQNRYWDASEFGYFTACLCQAQLSFANGIFGEITYGKGNIFWQGYRDFEIHGDGGSLIFIGERGKLVRGEEIVPIEVASRRGLFLQDTKMALDYLLENKPLYVSPTASNYALKVADSARKSSEIGQTIYLK